MEKVLDMHPLIAKYVPNSDINHSLVAFKICLQQCLSFLGPHIFIRVLDEHNGYHNVTSQMIAEIKSLTPIQSLTHSSADVEVLGLKMNEIMKLASIDLWHELVVQYITYARSQVIYELKQFGDLRSMQLVSQYQEAIDQLSRDLDRDQELQPPKVVPSAMVLSIQDYMDAAQIVSKMKQLQQRANNGTLSQTHNVISVSGVAHVTSKFHKLVDEFPEILASLATYHSSLRDNIYWHLKSQNVVDDKVTKEELDLIVNVDDTSVDQALTSWKHQLILEQTIAQSKLSNTTARRLLTFNFDQVWFSEY